MKTTVKIKKSLVTAPVDFDTVLAGSVCGVKLSVAQFDFVQIEGGKAVMFDAYLSAHRYAPFNAECGVVAFPFYCGCMTDAGERIAYAGLKFTDEKAAAWELLGKDEALGQLTVDPDAASVPVGSGVCCFSDEAGYKLYREHIKDEVHPLAGLIVLNGQTRAQVELYGKKYAVFSTGWGDGRYRCYAGRTAEGKVTAIIADFGMIDYPEDDAQVEVTVDTAYVFDPEKSDSENNIARWSRAIEETSDPSERMLAFSRRGYAYHSAGDTESALADYMSAVDCAKKAGDKARSRVWSVYDNAAEILIARGEYDRAILLMEDALRASGSFNNGVYVRLIDLYLLTKRTYKAAELAERMLREREDDPVAYVKYAECSAAIQDYKAAAHAYGELAHKFELYENLFDEAACLIELGDYAAADAALDAHPAKELYEQYWYYKAYADFKRRKYRAALASLMRARDIDGEYMPALLLSMDIQSLLQEHLSLARSAEEYKRMRPDNEYGYNVCAEAQLLLGNFSECARNYDYLYDRIKSDDKYAALSAVTSAKAGDRKRANAMLKILKRKHSPYYYGAVYGIYAGDSGGRRESVEKVVYLLGNDDEFLLALAAFLLQTNNVRPATQVLDYLSRDGVLNGDAVALNVRAAERIGDRMLFMTFLNCYVDRFVDPAYPADEKRLLAERFMSAPAKHAEWLKEDM